jgi:Holliday junction resolvase RusA-like endonuclease
MHIQELVLKGRIPSKKNSRITTRSGRSFPSKNYSRWHKDASIQLKEQGAKPHDASKVYMVFLMPDARRTDLTNKAESVADLLVDNGIIKDDSWQVIDEMLLRCDGIDRKNPRVEITLIKERAKNA